MHVRSTLFVGACACLAAMVGCGAAPAGRTVVGESAAIIGSVTGAGLSGKAAVAAQLGACPDVEITINGSPVSVVFEDDCMFLVEDVQPAESIVLRVELPDLAVSGTIELNAVEEGELIEILVEAGDDSLGISLVRRVAPGPIEDLPPVITGNNVTFTVPAGVVDHGLTVSGNRVTVIGEAGEACGAPGWTLITGDVLVNGNKATFRNIAFEGSVEIRGNAAAFINCCFGDELLVFGNGTDINGDDDEDDDDDDDDD